jgi:hypothetical protein
MIILTSRTFLFAKTRPYLLGFLDVLNVIMPGKKIPQPSFYERISKFISRQDGGMEVEWVNGRNIVRIYRQDRSEETLVFDQPSRSIPISNDTCVTFAVFKLELVKKELKRLKVKFKILRFFFLHEDAIYFNKGYNAVSQLELSLSLASDSGFTSGVYFPEGVVLNLANRQNTTEDLATLICKHDQIFLLSERTSNSKYTSISKNEIENGHQITNVFYLDNVSAKTVRELASIPEHFPNISRIFQDGIDARKMISTSNWTFPAAISIATGKRFEKHRIFHPDKSSRETISASLATLRSRPEDIDKNTVRIRTGANWRAQGHWGFSSLHDYCIDSHPFYTEAYLVAAQSKKAIDIFRGTKTLHYIEFMDSHHPLSGAPLASSTTSLGLEIICSGFPYSQRPDVSWDGAMAAEIYYQQLRSLDRLIGEVIDYSSEGVNSNSVATILISDHGTSFKNTTSLFDSLIEKHNVMCVINAPNSNIEDLETISSCYLGHEDITHILNFVSAGNMNDNWLSDLKAKRFGKSQVFYPGSPFIAHYFSGDSPTMCSSFETIESLPKDLNAKIWRDSTRVKDVLQQGNWTFANGEANLSPIDEVVNTIKADLNDTIEQWSRPPTSMKP